MDAISYSYADKAQKRIKKFIENPDSTSGVVTVPTTIAAGETITIPAGRMAVLPDLQIDGDLVVDGEVFIPNGTSLSKVVEKVPSTDNAIVRFDGTTGTVQNSGVIVDDSNNVGIGVPLSAWNANITAINFGYSGNMYSRHSGDGTHFGSNYYSDNADGIGARYKNSYYATSYRQGDGVHRWYTAPAGTAGNAITWTNAMTLDASGNVLLTSGTGGLGYGTGSGGTVTQLTSKSTSVTLNKPTGQITMNNAALAAGATIYFLLNNTLITADDVIITTIKDGTGADVRLYRVEAISQGSSFSWIKVTNTHSSSLSESIVIKYAIIKGANS